MVLQLDLNGNGNGLLQTQMFFPNFLNPANYGSVVAAWILVSEVHDFSMFKQVILYIIEAGVLLMT